MEKLLELLSENARLTVSQLAVMLNKSEKEVETAIENYEKAGVIKGYQTVVNWEKADQNKATALIEMRVTPKPNRGFDDIARRIMEFDEVESVSLMSGGYDLAVTVSGESMHQIADFVARRLSLLDSVLSTATHFMLKKYKDRGVIFDEENSTDPRGSVLGD